MIETLIPYLLLYKYTTIFLIAFAAAFVVPIPSGDILMVASAFARVGYFDIFWVIFLSIIANILGDNLGYFIARKYGREVLSRIGFRRVLESNNFKKIEEKFNKHPGFIIFASRFEVLSTLSVNLLSGISKTPYKKFLIHEATGSAMQVTFYSMAGYLFANSWEAINNTAGKVALVVGLILIIVLVAFGKKIFSRLVK
jgi:membrane protein DedA with SNARE-associated domain